MDEERLPLQSVPLKRRCVDGIDRERWEALAGRPIVTRHSGDVTFALDHCGRVWAWMEEPVPDDASNSYESSGCWDLMDNVTAAALLRDHEAWEWEARKALPILRAYLDMTDEAQREQHLQALKVHERRIAIAHRRFEAVARDAFGGHELYHDITSYARWALMDQEVPAFDAELYNYWRQRYVRRRSEAWSRQKRLDD